MGAVRYLATRYLLFTQDILDFDKSELEKRDSFKGREVGFDMMVDDIFALVKGTLIGDQGRNNNEGRRRHLFKGDDRILF